MTAPVNSSFYADPKGLTELRGQAQAQDPAALRKVAEQFESLFTKMVLKSMRQANETFGNGLFSSQQTQFYEGMFDDQLAVQLAQGKGMGLADMLVRQLSQIPGGNSTQSTPYASGASVTTSATSGASQSIAASKEDFVRAMWPHAERAAQKLGVDTNAVLAQAALETGWGKSVACGGDGACSFNLFGIKAGEHWQGSTTSVPTLEFEDGVAVKKLERFRAYASPAQSFDDYARLIANSPRYEDVRGTGSDIASFAGAMQRGGYATDPNYARKIVAVADELAGVKQRVDQQASRPFGHFPARHGRETVTNASQAGDLKASGDLPLNPAGDV